MKILTKLSKIHPSIIILIPIFLSVAIGMYFIYQNGKYIYQNSKYLDKQIEEQELELKKSMEEQRLLIHRVAKFQQDNNLDVDIDFLYKSTKELAFENYALSIKLKKLEAKIEKLENKNRGK